MKLRTLSRLLVPLALLPAFCSAASMPPTATYPRGTVNAAPVQPGVQPPVVGRSPAVTGAMPEPTQAEKTLQTEEEFQKRLIELAMTLASLEQRVTELRQQAAAPAPVDMELLEQESVRTQREIESLATVGLSPLAQLQRADLQERLFQAQFGIDTLKRRWGAGWTVFGLDFFQSNRPAEAADQRPAPRNYRIRTGDKLCVLILSSLGAQNEYHLTVQSNGTVLVPGAGKVTAAGKTGEQFEQMLNARIGGKFKQLRVDVTIEELHAVQVQVAGDVARPGTHVLHGVPTVMDALVAAGGPTKSGSFRRVALSREGEPKRTIDLYSFLLEGDRKQDVPIEDGDLIFVPAVGQTVTVGGEVIRPGRYEPTFPTTLGKMLAMAGGAKSGSYLQSVQVERVESNQFKVLLSQPLQGDGVKAAFVIQPGDEITVSSIRQDRTSKVDISGPVGAPGVYGFKEGMRVSELVALAHGLAPGKEIYGGRCDILRIDPLKGTEILTCSLDKALQHDEASDLVLRKLDRVFLYEPDQVVFRPRLVTVLGAVARPGTYKRTDGMRVADAIAAAGGLLPHAYLTRADLTRHINGDATQLVKVDLQSALDGGAAANTRLTDRDELMVYAHEDVVWQDRKVRVEGAVQRPGAYVRAEGMRVSDLLFACGGPLPEAGTGGELARCDRSGASQVIKLDISAIVAGLVSGSDSDVVLQDRDVITVPATNPYRRTPEIVYITGEVLHPGPYAITSENEKLTDLLERAGGLTNLADRNGLLFLRQKDSMENTQQEQDVDIILQKTKMFSDKQFLTQLAKLGVRLPDQFIQATDQSVQQLSKPAEVVPEAKLQTTVNPVEGQPLPGTGGAPGTTTQPLPGAPGTQTAPGVAPGPNAVGQVKAGAGVGAAAPNGVDQLGNNVMVNLATERREVSAMGPPLAEAAIRAPGALQGTEELASVVQSSRISVNLQSALADPATPDNLALRNGDRVFIPKNTNVVTVIGSVLHPHSFAAGPGKSVDYYIDRSGGYSQEASKQHVVVVRSNGDALPKGMVKTVEPGDMIVVPSTGLIDIAKKYEKVGGVTKIISDVLSSVFILTKL